LRRLSPLVACFLLSAFTLAAVRAQQPTATLSGVVTDPRGAVVSGAIVRATNTSTSSVRETLTNGEGAYALAALPPGEYAVRIEAQGFATKVSKGPVTLRVGQSVTLDATLEIGLREDVVVDLTAAPPVDTGGSKVDTVIEGAEIESLPLNGRNFLELALLTPGSAPAPNFDPTKTNAVGISSAG